jgi:2-C-methyl-D-erythritol 4-phosphate cytidylyltransferase
MKSSVLLPAAGRGLRMDTELNKQYLPLAGKPVLAHSIAACMAAQCFTDIIVIVTPGEENIFRRDVLLPWFSGHNITVVTGGKERQDSVYNGLQAVPVGTELVCVHDGARPLVKSELFNACLAEAKIYGGAIAAVPVKDTIKIVSGSQVVETPTRETLWAVQTPQAFLFNRLIEVHRQAQKDGFYTTDDAALLEHYGYPVRVVQGDYENIKVTTPEDLVLAEAFLRRRAQ